MTTIDMTTPEIAQDTPKSAAIIAMPQGIQMRPVGVKRSLFTLSEMEFSRLNALAEMLSTSQLSYAKNGQNKWSKSDLFIIMLKGMELGLEPMAAVESIDLIQGKPTLDPAGMLSLVYASGQMEDMRVLQETDTICEIMMKRVGKSEYTRSYTLDEAGKIMTTEWVNNSKQTIPLSQKSNWKSMPRIMLKWRLVSQMCRLIFPDIIQGLYTPEELGADVQVDETGSMIVVGSAYPTSDKPAAPAKAPSGATISNGGGERRVPPQGQGAPEGGETSHWAADEGKRKAFVSKFETLGLTWDDVRTKLETGTLLGKASDITLDFEAAMKRLDEIKPPPAQPKSQPSPPPEQPAPPADRDAAAKAANLAAWTGDDAKTFHDWMNEQGFTDPMGMANVKAWTDLPHPKVAVNRLRDAIIKAHTPFVAHSVTYLQTSATQSRLIFNCMFPFQVAPMTVISYSRDVLRNLGEDWAAFAEGLTPGKPGNIYAFKDAGLPALRVTWEAQKTANVVTGLEPVIKDDSEALLDEFFGEDEV